MIPKCDQCDNWNVNGTYTHEHACPNRHKWYDPEEQRWQQPWWSIPEVETLTD